MRTTIAGITVVASLLVGGVLQSEPTARDHASLDPPAIGPFLEKHCVRCHGPERAKAGLDLAELLERGSLAVDLEDWRLVREKIRHGEMPPEGEPRPAIEDIDRALGSLEHRLSNAIAAIPPEPGRVTTRRLNRRELQATILDLFGIDLDLERRLPADDVGEGFDHIGDVLGLSPMLLEKWVAIVEELARDVVMIPGEPRVPQRRYRAAELRLEGGGRRAGDFLHLYSRGSVGTRHRFPSDGTYRLRFELFGQQAGPEVVKFGLEVDGERRSTVEVPATRGRPGTYEIETHVARGTRSVSASFLNDYFRPDHPDPRQRDRNAGVVSIEVEGPLEGLDPTPFQRSLWPEEPAAERWRAALAEVLPELLLRVWRRPPDEDQVVALLDLVGRATPEGASASAHLRTAVVVALVSPRFIFRLEEDLPEFPPGSVRPLDGYERATRLSYFLHGAPPDRALLAAAAAGELDTSEGVRGHAARLFTDPRARVLSEAFLPQWLQFSHLEELRPDPQRYPGVDRRLTRDLYAETVELFEFVRREGRPVQELIDADYTFLNQRLARHYGIAGVRGNELRRVPISTARGGGLLAQGSILTATSTPTRTSPVMRGKWILEALLDSPPPPPPPGAGTLPAAGQPGSELSLREQLERHRADPTCASCHRRMDALGFAMEQFDAVGRWRVETPEADGATAIIDARGELPDGTIVDGVTDLRAVLTEDRAFLRALAKNLFVFALGRGLGRHDEPALERLVARLEGEPTIAALVDEIVTSAAFLERRVPPIGDMETGDPTE